MVKFKYFSGRSNKVKERFEICWIDHCVDDIENKNISGTYLEILISVISILCDVGHSTQDATSIMSWFM